MLLNFIFFLFLSCFLVLPSTGMIGVNEPWSVGSDDSFVSLWNFEFSRGGALDFSISLDSINGAPRIHRNNSIQLLFCTDTQLEPIRSVKVSDVCASPKFNYVPCLWQTAMSGLDSSDTVKFNISSVRSQDWYRLIALNCDGLVFNGVMSYVAVNPGGEYLSLSEIPLKSLFSAFSFIWLGLGTIWFYHCYSYRAFNIMMQKRLLLYPGVRVLMYFLYHSYWSLASETGHFNSYHLKWWIFAAENLHFIIFFTLMYFLSRGFYIILSGSYREETSEVERKFHMSLMFSMFLSYNLFRFVGGFVFFLMIFVLTTIIRYLLSNLTATVNEIMNEIHVLNRLNPSVILDNQYNEIESNIPVLYKLFQFKKLQIQYIIYISVEIIFLLWASIFVKNAPWMIELASAIITLFFGIFVGYTFTLKPFNPYYYQIAQLKYLVADGPNLPAADRQAAAPGNRNPAPRSHSSSAADDRSVPLLDGEFRSDSSSVSDSRSLDGILSLFGRHNVWYPGLKVPPIPKNPQSWIPNSEAANYSQQFASEAEEAAAEESEPLLLLEHPVNAVTAQSGLLIARPIQSRRAVPHGNQLGDNPLSAIPTEVLSYFPVSFAPLFVESFDRESAHQQLRSRVNRVDDGQNAESDNYSPPTNNQLFAESKIENQFNNHNQSQSQSQNQNQHGNSNEVRLDEFKNESELPRLPPRSLRNYDRLTNKSSGNS